ncbi:uncharacterized protein [Nicotiana tomentosiformis]|uniref:uncharacterized protein isoform X1 n=1 Tax=Nicotiana tomentosiformis TaxID=4098 RepID=UPI00051BA5B4
MDHTQKTKRPLSETDINVSQREKYKEMAVEKKQKLLLQRRLKYQESKRHTHSENITIVPLIGTMAGKERDETRPFSVYEKGSTSIVSNELHNKVYNIVTPKDGTTTTKFTPNISRLHSNYVSLQKVPICKFCSAKRFEYEPPAFCCLTGIVKLTSHQIPVKLHNLYLGNSVASKHFRTYIRTYNNLFAFTSLGIKYDKDLAKRNSGIYTFRVQGKMYHWINNLHPTDDKPRNIQLYFYDNSNALTHKMPCS